MREYEIDDRERVRLASVVRSKEDRFGSLEIPVAIFAPEETIKGLRGLTELVGGERIVHFLDGCVELEQNPFVVADQTTRVDFALDFAALHLTKAAGVPKFVAEVPSELDLLLIKQNVLPK